MHQKNVRKILKNAKVKNNASSANMVLFGQKRNSETKCFVNKRRIPPPPPKNLSTLMSAPLYVDIITNLLYSTCSQGAVPATIAILGGKIHVGASEEEIKILAETPRENVIKCSRRDFPFVIFHKLNGSTTVCGTMFVSQQAGIQVMATGGIGGVHRGAEFNIDISADLKELSRTSIAVVCSGVKSILDIPKTLEFLVSIVYIPTILNTFHSALNTRLMFLEPLNRTSEIF